MQWKLFADLAEVAGERTIDVDLDGEATVADALAALLDGRPALRERVLDEDGDLLDHVNLLRNGENVYHEGGLGATVDDDDELALFPPVSGG